MIEILEQPHLLEIIGIMTVFFAAILLALLKTGIFTLNGKRCDTECPDPGCRTCVVTTAETVRVLYEGQREIRDDMKELTGAVTTIQAQLSFLVKNVKGE